MFLRESVCCNSFYWLYLVFLSIQSWTVAGTSLEININICRTRASRFASAPRQVLLFMIVRHHIIQFTSMDLLLFLDREITK